MVQLSLHKGPPRMRSQLLGGTALSPRLCFTKAKKAVLCYKMDQLVALLPSFSHHLQYANFVLQGTNTERGHARVCANLWVGTCAGMGACPEQYGTYVESGQCTEATVITQQVIFTE